MLPYSLLMSYRAEFSYRCLRTSFDVCLFCLFVVAFCIRKCFLALVSRSETLCLYALLSPLGLCLYVA